MQKMLAGKGSMKLVQFGDETIELFDLYSDPYEEKDLSKQPHYLTQVDQLGVLLKEQCSLDKAGLSLEPN